MVENAASVRGWVMWALPLMALSLLLEKGDAIWLNLPGSGTKCVSEEIHNNVVVLADYVVISDDHVHPTPTISVKVRAFSGNRCAYVSCSMYAFFVVV